MHAHAFSAPYTNRNIYAAGRTRYRYACLPHADAGFSKPDSACGRAGAAAGLPDSADWINIVLTRHFISAVNGYGDSQCSLRGLGYLKADRLPGFLFSPR